MGPDTGVPPKRIWNQWMEVLWDGVGYAYCEQTDTCEMRVVNIADLFLSHVKAHSHHTVTVGSDGPKNSVPQWGIKP